MKGIPVKPLHQNPETGSIPLQNFNRSSPAVAERKHAVRIGIEFEFQLDNCSQSVIAFSQIGIHRQGKRLCHLPDQAWSFNP